MMLIFKRNLFGEYAIPASDLDGDIVHKTILSGSTLSHRLQYFDEQTEPNDMSSSNVINVAESAVIAHSFNTKSNLMTKKVIMGCDIDTALLSVVLPDCALWLHISSYAAIGKVLSHFALNNSSILRFFNDITFFPRSVLIGKEGIMLSLISLCIQDNNVCGKKVVAYMNGSIIITFEHRIVAAGRRALIQYI